MRRFFALFPYLFLFLNTVPAASFAFRPDCRSIVQLRGLLPDPTLTQVNYFLSAAEMKRVEQYVARSAYLSARLEQPEVDEYYRGYWRQENNELRALVAARNELVERIYLFDSVHRQTRSHEEIHTMERWVLAASEKVHRELALLEEKIRLNPAAVDPDDLE